MSAAKMLMLKLIIALSFAASMAMAVGDRRVALVIGNADYWNFPDLANPGNDAADLGARLEELGFEVILGVDQTRDELVSTLLDFARRLEGADTSLFFFAGHGMQINDVNHMIPVDAILSPELRVDDQTVTIDRVVQLMNQFTDNALVFLDACRDNPLTADIPIGSRDDGVGRGLARLRAAGGSYISFATAPGHVAYDGEGRNSPFTEALLRHISTPNVDIRLMMADVRRDVFEATAQQQLPWENNSLIGRFYFRQDDRLSRLDTQARTEAEAWEALSSSTQREDFAEFLDAFPDGSFASLAELKLNTLDNLDREASQERSDFLLARANDDVETWRTFIETHSGGVFAEIAREELSELEDEIARNRLSVEELHWRSIENSLSPSDFTTFLQIYPQSQFRDLAQQRRALAEQAREVTDTLDVSSDVALEREIKRRVGQLPVQFVQYGLSALGHPITDISGVIDSETRQAIRNYQATIGAPQTGRLTPQQSVDLILSAASLGDSHALTAAGVMTASGQGLGQDEATARLWFDRASDQGNGLAMANLGILFRDGRGGPRDVERARSLLTVAVTMGVDEAVPILRSLGE